MSCRGVLLCAPIGTLLLAAAARAGEGDARAIMEKYAATLPADEEATLRLDIHQRVGTGEVDLARPRLTVQLRRAVRGRGSGAQLRVDVLNPQSMAGIAMTATWSPAARKYEVHRFLPANSALQTVTYLNMSFMQSHLLYENVVPLVLDAWKFSGLPDAQVDGVDCHVVEAAPTGPSAFSRAVYYIRKDDSRAARVEYFERGFGKPQLKVTMVSRGADVQEWLAAGTGEKTVLTVTQRKAGAPAAERFNPESLKSDPSMVQLMKERAKLLEEEEKLAREIAALRAEMEGLRKK